MTNVFKSKDHVLPVFQFGQVTPELAAKEAAEQMSRVIGNKAVGPVSLSAEFTSPVVEPSVSSDYIAAAAAVGFSHPESGHVTDQPTDTAPPVVFSHP